MPAVIQRLFSGEDGLPSVQVAVRVEALFAGHEWEWSADRDDAYVWPDHAAADAAARAMGGGAFAVIRAVRGAVAPRASLESSPTARTAEDFRAVFEKMEREHPHEDVFAETERRCGS